MFKVLTLNNIADSGLRRLPAERFAVGDDVADPDAILLRSYDMHSMDIPESVAAIGRAGAGVNNIPVDAMSTRGVPVFNAPGANANAVKELAVAGILGAARNVFGARDYVKGLGLEGKALDKAPKLSYLQGPICSLHLQTRILISRQLIVPSFISRR